MILRQLKPKEAWIKHDNLLRRYFFFIPEDIDNKIPLVIFLHGGGSNPLNAIHSTGFVELAKKEKFAIVFPQGTGGCGFAATWNAGSCCGQAMQKNIDDVGFILNLKLYLTKVFPIDCNRVLVAGFSNGGMMAHRLGNEAPGEFAAIACVSGALMCEPIENNGPINVIIIHGDADQQVPINGEKDNSFSNWIRSSPFPSLSTSIEFWVRRNKCKTPPLIEHNEQMTIYRYEGGMNCTQVVVCVLHKGTHAWPGGKREWPLAPKPVKFFSATKFIWEFFSSICL